MRVGNGEFLLGDCLELMREIPDGSVDMVVTSPPYDNLRTYNGMPAFTFDVFRPIADQLARILKPGGVIVWNVADATVNGSETGSSFRQALYFKDECGLNLHDTMIWNKEACRFPDTVRYYDCFEYMFVLSKGKPKSINQIADKRNKHGGAQVHGTNRLADSSTKRLVGHNRKEVKEFGVRFNVWLQHNPGKAGNFHPATFPTQLASDHILSWSNPGDLVLDPFGGSGTTAIAAENTGRKWLLMEREPTYYEAAVRRVAGRLGMTELIIDVPRKLIPAPKG